MKVLLDTHALIWFALDDPKLSRTARDLVGDGGNEVMMSPASYWELAVKVSIGKLILNRPYDAFLSLCLDVYRFQILPIDPAHTSRLASLPFPPGHKDPFDRLLVCQAIVEGMPLVSADEALDAYPVQRLW